ncbi:OmpA family protein [Psychroflexus halocasei]|nr:OmpA family protein [Psychroflexus halocasei]
MKKVTFLGLAMLLGVSIAQAQTPMSESVQEKSMDYNKWSINANVGLLTASGPYISGHSDYLSDLTYGLGVRYMFNDKVGLMVDGAFAKVESDEHSAFDFSTKYSRVGLQGVVNLGSVLNFNTFTNRLGLLAHAGAGATFLSYDDGALADNEKAVHLILGFTPQFRVSDRVSLFLDVAMQGNLKQDITMDGMQYTRGSSTHGFDGMVTTLSAGISVYLGGNQYHADWAAAGKANELDNRVTNTENKLDEIEDKMADDDRDGIPNYLDEEPNTINGVAVDAKGRAVDTDGNGIPDEIDKSLQKKYITKSEFENNYQGGDVNSVKAMANSGLISVFFKFDSTQPEDHSYAAINKIVLYMKSNEGSTAKLTGYADQIGNKNYNMQLSKKRAKYVYDVLVASGISEDRLSYEGGGMDSSVNKDSSNARKLVRRVVFEIK